jgi:flagellar hook-basal body complex protein FliE
MAEPIAAINPIGMMDQTAAGVANVAPVVPENTTPFQTMLDSAVSSLENVSALEEKANAYIAQYAKGNVSMEEALMEVTKMSMAVEMATSIVNQAVTTFKEIQQMPV